MLLMNLKKVQNVRLLERAMVGTKHLKILEFHWTLSLDVFNRVITTFILTCENSK